jgi:vacuolar-type H+-ATPase subunit I/STV1
VRDPKLTPDQKLDGWLEGAINSERFQLASKWFHCIKVDARVVEENHPYHALFAEKNPPRMILSTWDGKKTLELLGTRKAKCSWKKLAKILDMEYRRNPDKAMKELGKLLSKYDFLDAREKELESQLASAKDKDRASKVKSCEKKIAELAKEREEAFALETKVRDLLLERELARKEKEKTEAKTDANRTGTKAN